MGDASVGKTALVRRYTRSRFDETTEPSIGVDFDSRIEVAHGTRLRMMIWDTAGQERFRAITGSYLRNADGVVVVFDITNKKSFDNLSTWLDQMTQHLSLIHI